MCRKACVQKIDVGPKAVVIQFHNSAKIEPEKLMNYVLQNQPRIKLRPDNKLIFAKDESKVFEENKDAVEAILNEVIALSV